MRNLITFIISVLILASCVPTAQEKESINSNLLDQGCEIPPSFDGYTCKGRFVATNMDELNSYLSDYGLKKGNVKHLKIDFDVVADAIQVTSPCSITVRDNASLTSTTGSSCLVAKGAVKAKGMNFSALNGNTTFASFEGNVIIDDNSTINTKNLNLIGQHKAVIQNTATINAHDIIMKSFGIGEDARVHIRHSSNVTANNIYLEAKRKATLGRDSLYNVSGTIRIIGEGPDDDSENPEFATIWKGTTVNTNELIINSLSKTKVSGGITVNANRVELSGPACSIGKTAVINSPVKEGNCFSGDHPTAVLKVAKVLRSGTAPHEVIFDASKSSDNVGIISYEWKLGDIETITTTGPNLTYTFVTPGVYKVRLKVIDGSGLFDYKTRKITVNEAPAPDGAPVAYFKFMTDEGELTTYFFGDAGSSPIVSGTYEVIGTGITQSLTDFHKRVENSFDSLTPAVYQVKLSLTDSEGLTNSFTHNVDLTTDEGAPYVRFKLDQSGPRQVFLNAVDSFDPYEFREISVDWGDGSELETAESFFFTHNYAAGGEYNITVKLTGESDKFTELSKTITINNETPEILNPVANYEMFTEFDGENTGHVRFLEQYSGSPNGEIISYAWDFGDGSTGYGSDVVHFYNPGVYFATLTVTDFAGKTNAQTQRVIVTEEGANLIVEVECFEDDVRSEPGHFICDVLAVDKSGELTEITLNWGDGTVETQVAESGVVSENRFFYKYISNGTFLVEAKATTLREEISSSTISLTPGSGSGNNIDPVAQIYCQITAPATVLCDSAGSNDPDGNIIDYYWNFGDGTETTTGPTNTSLSHQYQNPGLYVVSLTVVDNLNAEANVSTTVEISSLNRPPVVGFSCLKNGLNIVCDSSSTYDPDGDFPLSYNWDLGNGDIRFGDSIEYTYLMSGTYQVSLTVEDPSGLEDSLTQEIFIQSSPPLASFDCDVNNKIINCSSTSSDPDGDIVSYKWSMGDGTEKNEQFISHEYSLGSTYTVRLEVSDSEGSIDFIEKPFLINSPPIASFSEIIDGPLQVHLDASSSQDFDINDEIKSYEWRFPNGDILQGVQINYIFQSGGVYEIILKVTDSHGEIGELGRQLVIEENIAPKAIFTANPLEGNSPLTIDLDASESKDYEERALAYQWDFGDGSFGDGEVIQHTYLNNGSFEIKLVVTDHLGATDTSIKLVKVGEKPIPVLTANKESGVVKLDEFIFDSSQSSDNNFEIIEREWNFGDGKTANGELVSHRYRYPGSYVVTLKLTNEIGIINTNTINIVVLNDVITFMSEPINYGLSGDKFEFRPDMFIDDSYKDNLSFNLINSPLGMDINENSGKIIWELPEVNISTVFNYTIQAVSLTKIVESGYVITVHPKKLVASFQNIESFENISIEGTNTILDGFSISTQSNISELSLFIFGESEDGKNGKFVVKVKSDDDKNVILTPPIEKEIQIYQQSSSASRSGDDILNNSPFTLLRWSKDFNFPIEVCPTFESSNSTGDTSFSITNQVVKDSLINYEVENSNLGLWYLKIENGSPFVETLVKQAAEKLNNLLISESLDISNIIVYHHGQLHLIAKAAESFPGELSHDLPDEEVRGFFMNNFPNFVFVNADYAFKGSNEEFLRVVVHENSHRLQYNNYGCANSKGKFLYNARQNPEDNPGQIPFDMGWIHESIAERSAYDVYPEVTLTHRFKNLALESKKFYFPFFTKELSGDFGSSGLLTLDGHKNAYKYTQFPLIHWLGVKENFWTWIRENEQEGTINFPTFQSSHQVLESFVEGNYLEKLKEIQKSAKLSSFKTENHRQSVLGYARYLANLSNNDGIPFVPYKDVIGLTAKPLGSKYIVLNYEDFMAEVLPSFILKFDKNTEELDPDFKVIRCNEFQNAITCPEGLNVNLKDYPKEKFSFISMKEGGYKGASLGLTNHDFSRITEKSVNFTVEKFIPKCLAALGDASRSVVLNASNSLESSDERLELRGFRQTSEGFRLSGEYEITAYTDTNRNEIRKGWNKVKFSTIESESFLNFSFDPADLEKGSIYGQHSEKFSRSISGILSFEGKTIPETGEVIEDFKLNVHFDVDEASSPDGVKRKTNCSRLKNRWNGNHPLNFAPSLYIRE